jgi:hypothetical protein
MSGKWRTIPDDRPLTLQDLHRALERLADRARRLGYHREAVETMIEADPVIRELVREMRARGLGGEIEFRITGPARPDRRRK